jgi:hypothetical protein
MDPEELRHLDEAQRQADAAALHERSARFWEARGDHRRAVLESEQAVLALHRAKRARNEAAFAPQRN